MLKIVKEQFHSWWWPAPFKTPVFVIDRSRVSLPVDYTVKENIKCSGGKKNVHFFAVLKSFSVIDMVRLFSKTYMVFFSLLNHRHVKLAINLLFHLYIVFMMYICRLFCYRGS